MNIKNRISYKLIIIFSVLLVAAVAIGEQLKPFPFAFIGRWQPAEDPLLIDDGGFQDIQNLRKDGKRLKGVGGHTSINTIVLDNGSSTYIYPKNGFHFKKESPSESHVIVYSTDSAGLNPRLYQNTTAIPSTGNFSSTILFTDTTGGTVGRFSDAPQGNMLYANSIESCIWGGNEYNPTSFVISSATITVSDLTNPIDYTSQITNNETSKDQVAIVGEDNDYTTYLLLHNDGSDGEAVAIADSSTSGAGGNADSVDGNAQLDTDQKMFGTASLYLDGTGDSIQFSDSDGVNDYWAFGSAAFTIDLWFRPYNADAGESQVLVAQYTDATHYFRFMVTFSATQDQDRVYFESNDGGNTVAVYSNYTELKDNTWYHASVVRGWGGNVNDWVCTIDGTAGTTVTDADALDDMAGNLYIGASTGQADFYGWIDEVRIAKVAKWESDFTPRVRPYSYDNRHFLVGSTRPLQGVKFYVGDENTVTASISASYWNGGAWTDLTVTDNTSGLNTTGTVTWATTEGDAKVRFLNGLVLYWYQFRLTAGSATIYRVTADAPFQEIKNIWDGERSTISVFKKFPDPEYIDYSDEVIDDTTTYYALLNSLNTTHAILMGFSSPQQGFEVFLIASKENSTASVLTVNYWDGTQWTAVPNMIDRTSTHGITLGQSGTITFDQLPNGQEFPTSLVNEEPIYYYKLTVSVQLDAEVHLYHVKGIPATSEIPGYKFPGFYQNRAFLFNEANGLQNKAIYSAYNAPDIWNGSDTGSLYFGDESSLTSAVTIYNVFQTTGYEQLLVTKENETYRIVGDGPDNWEMTKMSGNVGCVAPLSMAVCEIADISEGVARHVAIWQASHGIVMSDGATIKTISDDISNYFDPNSSDYIPIARQDDSVGWYDPNLQSYKLLISSGSGQTTHNIELEYSLKYREWTKLYRENGSGANPLQIGFPVHDTTGRAYSYGATNEGTIYYTENSVTWNGTDIAEYVWTKDLMLDSMMADTYIEYFRLMFEQKTNEATEDIGVIYYCDRSLVADGSDNQEVPDDIDPDDNTIVTQSVSLGPCVIHSFKLSASVSSMTDGIEPLGMGLYYYPTDTISGVND